MPYLKSSVVSCDCLSMVALGIWLRFEVVQIKVCQVLKKISKLQQCANNTQPYWVLKGKLLDKKGYNQCCILHSLLNNMKCFENIVLTDKLIGDRQNLNSQKQKNLQITLCCQNTFLPTYSLAQTDRKGAAQYEQGLNQNCLFNQLVSRNINNQQIYWYNLPVKKQPIENRVLILIAIISLLLIAYQSSKEEYIVIKTKNTFCVYNTKVKKDIQKICNIIPYSITHSCISLQNYRILPIIRELYFLLPVRLFQLIMRGIAMDKLIKNIIGAVEKCGRSNQIENLNLKQNKLEKMGDQLKSQV